LPRADVFAAQSGGEGFALVAREGVDDAGDVLDPLASGFQLGAALAGGTAGVDALEPGDKVVVAVVGLVAGEADLEVQVRAVGGHGEVAQAVRGAVEAQSRQNVGADLRVGGGGEAHDGNIREGVAEPSEALEVLAEIVAPFRDAVGFVDHDAGEFFLLVDEAQAVAEAVEGAELRGDIQEAGARVAGGQVAVDVVTLLHGSVAVEGAGVDVGSAEGLDLVHHEAQQGGDDDGDCRNVSTVFMMIMKMLMMKGELRVNILPRSMTAGSWKHRLLPNEVAAWTKTS
jgi:hypothetical protein